MKTLKYILEVSLLGDIDDTLADGDVAVPRVLIQKFLEENYTGKFTISKKPNKDGKFEVSALNSLIRIKPDKRKELTSITNGDFVWTYVASGFDISHMPNLETLEGMPREIGGSLWLNNCPKLKSLDGFPEKVGTKDKGAMIYIGRTGTPKFFKKDDVMKVCKKPADGFIHDADYGPLG